MENRPIPQSGEFYMHFKGKIYQIITVATHTETGESLVIYQALYGTYKTYARPLDMFLSEVDHEKYPKVEQKYRFRKVELCENAGDQIAVVIREEKDEPKEVVEEKKAEEIKEELEDNHQDEEVNMELLLKFLDETDLEERLNILVKYKDEITETMLESMGMAIDTVLMGKNLEEKYYELDKVIRTKLQYEKKPRI